MTPSRPTAAAVLTVLGGVLIAAVALALVLAADLLAELNPVLVDSGTGVDVVALLQALGYLGLVLGGLIVLLRVLIHRQPRRARAYGVVVLVLSVLSLLTGAGLFAGMVLGVLGGILAVTFRPAAAPPTYPPPPPP